MNASRSPVGSVSVAASASGAVLAVGERVEEHGVDERRRRLAAGAVGQRDDVVGQPGPAAAERLDAVEDGGLALAGASAIVGLRAAACTAAHSAKPSAAWVSWIRWTLSERDDQAVLRRRGEAAISPPS